jgi:CBS domain-containing protein
MSEPSNVLERRLAAEHKTLARPLRSLVSGPPLVCSEAATIAEAVARMQADGVGSIVVVDGNARPIGIFTERDLVGVVASGGLDRLLAEVMTREPFGLPGHTPAYEAALAMLAQRIRHVLVTDDNGALIGVISERDLFSLQRLGLGELTMEIRLAKDVATLAALAERMRRLTRLLVEQGVAPEHLTLFVSVLNDRLCARIIELERKRHRFERLAWCWLAFGSEGRFEQTFATDQDNGLIFQAHGGQAADAVRALLLPFARSVNEALDACGFPLCKGNVMASNPSLCLSLDEWKAKMRGWLDNSDPKALLDAAICFDFRALHGDARLAAQLREWLLPLTRRHANFLRLMAENALKARPPLNVWGGFATEADASNTINLKLYGVRPIVDTARLLGLARGLPETNTAERLRAAAAAGALPAAEAEASVASFYFLQGIRLRRQATAKDFADDTGNRIDPTQLNELEQRTLKEAFRIARDLQSRLALDYQL